MLRKTTLMTATLSCGLALGLAVLASQFATKSSAQGPQAERRDGQAASADGGQIEKVLDTYNSYRDRVGQNEEQIRKDLDRQVKELSELIELRMKLSLALAETRCQSMGKGNTVATHPMIQELKSVHAHFQGEIMQAWTQLDLIAGHLHAAKDSMKPAEAMKSASSSAKVESSPKPAQAPKAAQPTTSTDSG